MTRSPNRACPLGPSASAAPSLLLQSASCWKTNSGSTLLAFDEGYVGHSSRSAIKSQPATSAAVRSRWHCEPFHIAVVVYRQHSKVVGHMLSSG